MVIYDGVCAFCRKSVWLLQLWAGDAVEQAVPYQSLDDAQLAALGTDRGRCQEAVQFLVKGRPPAAGADAVFAALARAPKWSFMVRILRLAPIAAVARRVYRLVATCSR